MMLNGFSWALMYIGGSFYLMQNSPRSTGIGVFGSTVAVAIAIGPICAGIAALLYDWWAHSHIHSDSGVLAAESLTITHGYIAVLYMAAAMTALAFAISLRMRRARDSGDWCSV